MWLKSDGLHPGATTRVIGPERSSRQRETTGSLLPKLTSSVPPGGGPQRTAVAVLGVEPSDHDPGLEVALLEPTVQVAAEQHAALARPPVRLMHRPSRGRSHGVVPVVESIRVGSEPARRHHRPVAEGQQARQRLRPERRASGGARASRRRGSGASRQRPRGAARRRRGPPRTAAAAPARSTPPGSNVSPRRRSSTPSTVVTAAPVPASTTTSRHPHRSRAARRPSGRNTADVTAPSTIDRVEGQRSGGEVDHADGGRSAPRVLPRCHREPIAVRRRREHREAVTAPTAGSGVAERSGVEVVRAQPPVLVGEVGRARRRA